MVFEKRRKVQGLQGRQLIVLLEMTMLSTSTSPPYARYARKLLFTKETIIFTGNYLFASPPYARYTRMRRIVGRMYVYTAYVE